MTKAEFVEALAKKTGSSKAAAGKSLDAIFELITANLKKGVRVPFVGFGTFAVAKRKARTGRNPQTGKEIKIAAKKVPKFTAGAKLKDAVK
jgi:DNA-binding protein HU-beta